MVFKSIIGAACTCLAVVSFNANAALITLNFTGTITSTSGYTENSSSIVGTSFSGYITYDADNAESITFGGADPGATTGVAGSASGCSSYINGVCNNDRGDDTPVVVDYQLNWIGGVVTSTAYTLDIYDGSQRSNSSYVAPAPIPNERWQVTRNQYRSDINGDTDNGTYTSTLDQKVFILTADLLGDGLLSEPISNFDQGFDIDTLFLNGSGYIDVFDTVTVETCVASNCTSTINEGSYRFQGDLTTASFTVAPIPVVIDIKPYSETNSINISSAGVIPVAILGTADFDVSTVEPTSVSLAGASVKMVGKSGKYLCHQEDVNLDGFIDLICQIYTAQFFVEEGETTAILEAETYDGTKLRGEDVIRIVPDN